MTIDERVRPDEMRELDAKQAKDEGVSKTTNTIGDPMEVLMDEETRKDITDTLVLKRKKKGKDVTFEVKIRALEAPEYDKINDDCTIVSRNKRSGNITKEVDQKQFRRMVAYAAVISPDLTDKNLVEKFHVKKGKEWEAMDAIFLPGEVDYIGTEAMKLSGYTDDYVESVSKS